jgi:dolichyl-phosphate-mannose-protein mannosyltransferase
MTGISLGLAASVKWIGLFVIATVGVSTLKNLWGLIDNRITARSFANHFAARAFALIVLPVLVYMAIFQLHFSVLRFEGTGKGFMTPEFQTTLDGSKIADTVCDVGVNSGDSSKMLGTFPKCI